MSEMSMKYVQYLLRLNRADFNAVRKAVNTLLRAGVDFEYAAQIVLDAHLYAKSAYNPCIANHNNFCLAYDTRVYMNANHSVSYTTVSENNIKDIRLRLKY